MRGRGESGQNDSIIASDDDNGRVVSHLACRQCPDTLSLGELDAGAYVGRGYRVEQACCINDSIASSREKQRVGWESTHGVHVLCVDLSGVDNPKSVALQHLDQSPVGTSDEDGRDGIVDGIGPDGEVGGEGEVGEGESIHAGTGGREVVDLVGSDDAEFGSGGGEPVSLLGRCDGEGLRRGGRGGRGGGRKPESRVEVMVTDGKGEGGGEGAVGLDEEYAGSLVVGCGEEPGAGRVDGEGADKVGGVVAGCHCCGGSGWESRWGWKRYGERVDGGFVATCKDERISANIVGCIHILSTSEDAADVPVVGSQAGEGDPCQAAEGDVGRYNGLGHASPCPVCHVCLHHHQDGKHTRVVDDTHSLFARGECHVFDAGGWDVGFDVEGDGGEGGPEVRVWVVQGCHSLRTPKRSRVEV